MRYKNKPFEVEAFLLDGYFTDDHNMKLLNEPPEWVRGMFLNGMLAVQKPDIGEIGILVASVCGHIRRYALPVYICKNTQTNELICMSPDYFSFFMEPEKL